MLLDTMMLISCYLYVQPYNSVSIPVSLISNKSTAHLMQKKTHIISRNKNTHQPILIPLQHPPQGIQNRFSSRHHITKGGYPIDTTAEKGGEDEGEGEEMCMRRWCALCAAAAGVAAAGVNVGGGVSFFVFSIGFVIGFRTSGRMHLHRFGIVIGILLLFRAGVTTCCFCLAEMRKDLTTLCCWHDDSSLMYCRRE